MTLDELDQLDWRGRRAAYPLDHAVISVRDRMDEAVRVFGRLGFTLTPRGTHRTGSINHLMVFDTDYLELIGFPPGGAHLRPDIAGSPIGLDGLVLRPHGTEATYAEVVGRGFRPGKPETLSRPVVIGGREHEARFGTVRFPREAFAPGRLYFCEQLTPHLVWRPEWRGHANGATGIDCFTIVVPDPHREAAHFAGMLAADAYALDPERAGVALSNSRVEFVTAAAHRKAVGAQAACEPLDVQGRERASYMAMLTVRTESLAAAAAALGSGGVGASRAGERLIVPAREAMNCTLAFFE